MVCEGPNTCWGKQKESVMLIKPLAKRSEPSSVFILKFAAVLLYWGPADSTPQHSYPDCYLYCLLNTVDSIAPLVQVDAARLSYKAQPPKKVDWIGQTLLLTQSTERHCTACNMMRSRDRDSSTAQHVRRTAKISRVTSDITFLLHFLKLF